MTEFEKIKKALLSKGFNEKDAQVQAKKLVDQGISFEQVINEFVKEFDKDPTRINSKNCDSGKCCDFNINWKNKH